MTPRRRISARIIIEAKDGANAGRRKALCTRVSSTIRSTDRRLSLRQPIPPICFPTEPYDWTIENKEEIIVNYSQPVFSAKKRHVELGERKYFGYVIQLYYQDELQDRVVRPPELEQYQLDAPLSSPQEPRGLEPENALFPD